MTDAFLDTVEHVRPGDCIVCFSKKDIYTVSRQLEKQNIEVAVIYGTLPAGGCHPAFIATKTLIMLS